MEKREPPAHFKAQVRATRTEYSDVGEAAAAAVRATFSATMQTHSSERSSVQIQIQSVEENANAGHQDGSGITGEENLHGSGPTETKPVDDGRFGPELQRKRHKSLEDLNLQQTTGIELARLLRVCRILVRLLHMYPNSIVAVNVAD